VKRALLLGLAVVAANSANAANAIPDHLTGVWGTAESLWAGTVAQFELQLQADGFGMFAVSTKPATRTDGKDHDGPAPRVIMGLPLRATFEGNVLTAQPFIPPGIRRSGDNAPRPEEMRFSCRYQAESLSMTCSGPKQAEVVVKRRSETLPVQTTELLKQMQAVAEAQ
jgi:hypothetical protein